VFNFEKTDRADLADGPTPVSSEGEHSILDHRWMWMGLFIFALGVILRDGALVALTGFMLATVAFGWLWSRFAMQGISYRRTFHHRRAFEGETLEMSITIENRKWLPVTWMQVEDEWPTAFGPADESLLTASSATYLGYLVNVYSLRRFERVRRRYTLQARARGIYYAGPAHLISGDPFNLFERGAQVKQRDVLIIYPKLEPLDSFGIDARDPFGEVRAAQRLFEDPARTVGVREYRRGDSFRAVHWKATAHTAQLQVRQYEPTRSMSMVLCLNVASFEQHWRGIWPQLVEHLIRVAASFVGWGLERGYAVGILANATLVQADRALLAQPSRDRDQLTHLLEMLAGITSFISREFSEFLLAESARLPWGATLLIITGFVNEPILGAILQLRASGRRVVLVAVGKEAPPQIAGVITHHSPLVEAEPTAPPAATLRNSSETARERFLRERITPPQVTS